MEFEVAGFGNELVWILNPELNGDAVPCPELTVYISPMPAQLNLFQNI